MTSAPPQRAKSAREVKCASWRAPQQAARGAFLSSLRRCTMLAPALRATPQFLPLLERQQMRAAQQGQHQRCTACTAQHMIFGRARACGIASSMCIQTLCDLVE